MHSNKMSPLYRTVIISVTFLICYFLIMTAAMPARYSFKEGDICTEDIYATREIEDTYTTNRHKEAAAEQVKPRYKINNDITKSVEASLSEFMSFVWNTSQMEDMQTDMKLSVIEADTKVNVSGEILRSLISMPKKDFEAVQKTMTSMLRKIMDEGVLDKESTIASLSQTLIANGATNEQAKISAPILAQFIKVNKEFDEEATENEKQRMRDLVEPTVYKQNQIIVRRGEQIKVEQIEMLSALGLLEDSIKINYTYAIGIGLFLLIAFSIVGVHIWHNEREFLHDRSKFIFLNAVPLLTVGGFFIFARYESVLGRGLLPALLCSILVSVFIGRSLSMLLNIILSICLCIMLKADMLSLAGYVITGFFAAYIFRLPSSFGHFAIASGALSAIEGAVFAVMGLIGGGGAKKFLENGALGVLNGVITCVLAMGIIPFFELTFDIITPLKLSELSNPERKLLKRMLFETPGTYHHALMVGNLAEAACASIGADAFLARVGAYYHDIGKLKHPSYFKENQITQNPHDSLPYEESAKVLIGHVKEGESIGRQYRLPKSIREIISQHHGTTLAGDFYQKAVLEFGAEHVKEENFHYPGPKPQTKEAAIVMLADSCEAAVRSLENQTEEAVRGMVDKIINGRLTDGQLSESDLTLRDLEKIKTAFLAMFEGYFHKRIQYTELLEDEGNG